MLFENITIFAIVSWKKFITNVDYATVLIVYYIKWNYTYHFFSVLIEVISRSSSLVVPLYIKLYIFFIEK